MYGGIKELMCMLGVENIEKIREKYMECKGNYNINDKLYWYCKTVHNDTLVELKYNNQNALVFCCIVGLLPEVNFIINLEECDMECDNHYAFRVSCYYKHEPIVKLLCEKSELYSYYIKNVYGDKLIIPIINGEYIDESGNKMNEMEINRLKRDQFEDVSFDFEDYIK